MPISDFLSDLILNHVTGRSTWTSPVNLYVSLHTASPADANELSSNNYSRINIGTGSGNWTAPTDDSGPKKTTNVNELTFPIPSGDWSTATHFALYDASSSGNLLTGALLDVSRTASVNDVLSIAAGALKITLSTSDYLETAILDHLTGRGTFASPSGLFVSLHTADPSGANELSGNGYARASAGVGSANWTAPSADGSKRVVSNVSDVSFASPTGTWSTASHYGIYDASSGGNLLYTSILSSNVTGNINDTIRFQSGDLKISVE